MKMKIAAAGLFMVLSASLLYGQAFRNPPPGAASIMQAGAFAAQADDASAVFQNPAGLIQIKGHQIMLGSDILFPETKYKSPGFSEYTDSEAAYLPYFFFSTDFRGTAPLRFGLGVTVPYGQSTKWSYDAVRNWFYSVPRYSAMQTVNISPALAYGITPELSAGAGFNIYRSKLELKYLLPPPPPPPGEMQAKVDVDGTGYGGTFGLLYKTNGISIGATYKTGYEIDYDGDYSVPGVLKEDAETAMDFPPVACLGIAVYPNSKLKLEFDAEWVGYSCMDKIPVDITVIPPYEIDKDWDDCYTFAIGAEYKKSERTVLRGGIAYLTTPIPDSTFEPSMPDSNSWIITAGGEFITKIGSFNLTLGAHLFNDRKIDNGGPYDGKYESRGYFGAVEYKKGF